MDQRFSHHAGTPGDPQVTVTPSAHRGYVATASDVTHYMTSWGPTENDARTRVQALWHWNPDLRRNHAS